MTFVMSLLALLLASQAFAQPPEMAGDWQGTLGAGAAELRLVLHVARSADGTLAATMDSPDQGVRGLPVSALTLKDGRLSFKVENVRGTYEGTLGPSGTEVTGTWSQGQPLPLTLVRRATPRADAPPPAPSDIDATWGGTLSTPAGSLRVVFHIANSADGLTATMDSPDQNVRGLSVTTVTRTGATLRLELKRIGGTFTGTIADDRQTIDGTWTQAGGSAPLVLTRTKSGADVARRRPQVPAPPLPYREEDVTIDTHHDGVRLSGTLTIPAGTAPFPAVVLISGSGPQDRDESLMGHRPFLVLADHLTRRGIAVLRTDDRGTGRSTGTFAGATSMDFASDAEASLAFLRGRRGHLRTATSDVGATRCPREHERSTASSLRPGPVDLLPVVRDGPGERARDALEFEAKGVAGSGDGGHRESPDVLVGAVHRGRQAVGAVRNVEDQPQ